jgi:hypothetical protein
MDVGHEGVERFWGASRRFAPTAVYAHFKALLFHYHPLLDFG